MRVYSGRVHWCEASPTSRASSCAGRRADRAGWSCWPAQVVTCASGRTGRLRVATASARFWSPLHHPGTGDCSAL